MNTWKVITGIIILVIGIGVFWQNYRTVSSCHSLTGEVSTALTSLFGGNGAQSCYDAGIAEVAGIIVAIIGLVILFSASRNMPRKARK